MTGKVESTTESLEISCDLTQAHLAATPYIPVLPIGIKQGFFILIPKAGGNSTYR